MTGLFTKKKVPRQQAQKPKSKPKKKSAPRSAMVLPQYALALLDPFNDQASGAKVPDSNMAESLAFKAVGNLSVGTDGVFGSSAAVFHADPSSYANTYSTVASAQSVTWPAAWTAQYTVPNISTIRTSVSAARTVGFGVSITNSQNYTTATGKVHVCHFFNDFTSASPNAAYPTSVTQMKQCIGYQEYSSSALIENKILVSGRPIDQSSQRYRSLAQQWDIGSAQITSGIESNYGWLSIMVFSEAVGLTIQPLDIEYAYHLEGLVKPGASLFANNHASPFLPATMAAVTNVLAATPPVRMIDVKSTTSSKFVSQLERAFETAIRWAPNIIEGVKTIASLAMCFV